MKIVTAVNESDTYLHFIPTVSQTWQKMFGYKMALGFITDRDENDPLVKEMGEYADVTLFKPISEVPTGNQAKITRMYLATLFEDDTSILMDLDMYMLNKSIFEGWMSEMEEDKILTIGSNAYLDSPSEGKFPMCYVMGKGKLFKGVVNPENKAYEDLLSTWCSIKDPIDNKESINQPHNKFSDESLLRYIIERNDKMETFKHFYREDFVGMRATKRIDRWPSMNYSIKELFSGNYIDAAPERPINYGKMIPIFEYLELDMDRIKFKNK